MNERVLSLALTVLMVASVFSTAGAGLAAASTSGNDAGNDSTFHVAQGGDCYEIAAMGDGTESVEDFYDYRKPSNNEKYNYTYSSHGTKELQENQVSNIFVYEGTDGYNVVILHDKLDVQDEDGEYGSTVTFNFSNMDGVTWKVRDDNYSFEDDDGNYHENDDNWSIEGSDHSVDWMWADHRTDGGAFSGFGDNEITITPFFNDSAPYWGKTAETGNESEMVEWRVLDENGDKAASLDMNQEVSIQKGGCPDETNPNADLTANPNTVGNDESVTLDASGSTDDGGSGIAEYRWDFDGDDEIDETTTEKTSFEHTYDSPGDYTASVTVVDGNGNTDTATADVTVVDRSETNITFINGTAVEVEGTYESVQFDVGFYDESGYGNVKPVEQDVSGTTVIEVDDHGVNGSVINTVALYENSSDAEPVEERKHPNLDYWSETIKPHPVTVSVEDVTETDEGTYEVTFGYDNPNDESLDMRDSTLSGNVAGEAPEVVEPGENTFTVTWTPESDDERATWTLDRTNFGHEETSASTEQAGEYGDGGSGGTGPDADLVASPTEGYGETEFTFDASGSSADDVAEYEWDFDGDGKFETTTESPETTRTYSEVGTHEVTVKVVDANGNTDTASTNVTVFKVKSGDDDPPTARLSVPEKGSMSQLLYPFDATDSTDDDEIIKYRWDFDSDGDVEWTDNEDGISSIKPYQILDEPGTYEATVTVVDSAGQTDTASATYTVEKVVPNATIHASTDSIEVGEEVTFTAKNFNEAPDDLKHICWKVGDEPGPDGTTWTTTFEESGQKTIKLVLRDRAGYEHVVTKDVTVTAADDGDNGGDDGNNGDDGNDKGYEDDPNDGNKGGGLPPANPDDGDNSNDDGTVSAPLKGENGEMGQISLLPAAEDGTPGLEVSQTAPARVEAPSVAEDGFEPVAYVTVTDADSATFTVSKDRLDEVDATADDVTLFRYDDGTWTAVETEQVGETDDGFEFEANTSDATYAVGIDQPATSVTDLAVETQRVQPGETVTVVATVENDGRAAGTHEVQLTVGGDVVATQTVEVAAGETAEVSLTHAFDDGGVYDVTVDGETAEVVVEAVETQTTDDSDEAETTTSTTTNDGAGVPGFGVSVSVVALVGAALLALRRR